MNYTILCNEISTDPLERGYAQMTDQEVANSLTTANRTLPDSTRKTFRCLLRDEGMEVSGTIYAKLKIAAESNPGVELAVSACADYSGEGGLDFSDAKTIEGIETLVAGEVLSESEGDKLKALGQKTVSRATELGLSESEITNGRIESARIKITQGA